MADTRPYRAAAAFDYRTPVLSWPYWIRVRWPNTIAMLTLQERWQQADGDC